LSIQHVAGHPSTTERERRHFSSKHTKGKLNHMAVERRVVDELTIVQSPNLRYLLPYHYLPVALLEVSKLLRQ